MHNDSFTEFLQNFGTDYPPTLVHQPGQDFCAWQKEFRAAMDALRGPLPPRVEPEVEILGQVQEDGYTRHTLCIAVSSMTRLPAYLLIPDGLRSGERRPGLLVSHGHDSHGIDSICGVRGMDSEAEWRQAYAVQAVKAGYVVLAPGWWGWTGREKHLSSAKFKVGGDKCNLIQMAASMYGISVLSLHIQDGQAALDVLAKRPEVDPERLGCIGNSYGGRTTMWLAAFDTRIRASVASGCMNTLRERSLRLSSCGIQYLPGMLQFGDVAEVFSLIAPRPLQLQAGREDKLINSTDRDAIEITVRSAYRALGEENQFDYTLHGEGHILIWELAEAFLRRHLG